MPALLVDILSPTSPVQPIDLTTATVLVPPAVQGVVISEQDDRGVLFGIGYLLRQLDMAAGPHPILPDETCKLPPRR